MKVIRIVLLLGVIVGGVFSYARWDSYKVQERVLDLRLKRLDEAYAAVAKAAEPAASRVAKETFERRAAGVDSAIQYFGESKDRFRIAIGMEIGGALLLIGLVVWQVRRGRNIREAVGPRRDRTIC